MAAPSQDERAAAFCRASIRDWTGRAARMLAETPELAGHSLATALVLGDVARVREEVARDPGAATRWHVMTTLARGAGQTAACCRTDRGTRSRARRKAGRSALA